MNYSCINKSFLVVGRVLLGLIFITSGYGKLMDFSGTAAHMESVGMPLVPLMLVGAIAVELGAGLSVFLGIKARWGALALFLFLIPTTLIFHKFWGLDNPDMAMMQHINFMKNIAIMGGMLVVAAAGPDQPGIGGLCPCCCSGDKCDS